MNIRNNIDTVTENIARACESSGRSDDSVKLIAVSKTKSLSDIYEASQAGITDFGENYVQEILEKYPLMPEGTRIHMIGHLQTNKVKKVIDKVCMIHSVDSVRLAEVISRETQKRGITMDILLEVNIADEPSKYGFAPQELIPSALLMLGVPKLRIKGLMTSAPLTDDGEKNRIYFRRMSGLLSELRTAMSKTGIPLAELPSELSMGMTDDYEAAVMEGSTMVRVGTAIFGAREYNK